MPNSTRVYEEETRNINITVLVYTSRSLRVFQSGIIMINFSVFLLDRDVEFKAYGRDRRYNIGGMEVRGFTVPW